MFRKPTPDAIARFLAAQHDLELTYAAVGATSGEAPPGYVVDHTRVRLGAGESTYHAAIRALRRWDHFRFQWIESWPVDVPLKTSETVAVLGCILGTWWLNACRIVYVVDQKLPHPQFGFAYGTLPGHAESGEERFLVEMLPDETVWYDIRAFSRPRHALARLGRPLVRVFQKRFGRDSALAMCRTVDAAVDGRILNRQIIQT